MAIKRIHRTDCAGGDCKCPWRLDYRPLGVKGPRRMLQFKTKGKAEQHRADTQVKVRRGEYVAPEEIPTFKAAAETWYASKTDRRASHVADLRSRLDKHLLPRFGALRLNHISVGMIESLRNDLRAQEYAPRTINTIVRIAGAVFRAAIRRHQAVSNPVADIEPAFKATRELVPGEDGARDGDSVKPDSVLSPSQVRLMLDAATPGYYRTLFTMAFVTGMRSGELLALQWGNIEFDAADGSRGKIHVERTMSRARVDPKEPVRPRFYPPKTEAGTRWITIAPAMVSMLKAWKIQCSPSDLDLVFPGDDGQPACRDRILKCGLHPALRRAELLQVTFHSLRHSCASAMIAAGAPITEVQHRLGHASPAITLRVYSHFFKDAETGAADRLAEQALGVSSGTRRKWKKSGRSKPVAAARNRVSA